MEEKFITEDNQGVNLLNTSKKDSIEIQEKTITEVVQILYDNMKDQHDNELIIITRKSLIELSEKNLSIILKLGIDTIRNQLNSIQDAKNATLNQSLSDSLNYYINLIQEIIEKFGNNIDRTTFRIISTFVIDCIQNYIVSSNKEPEKQKLREQRVIQVNKLLIYIANVYFQEVLIEIMNIFTPGSVPNRIIIELLTELGNTYSDKCALYYSDVISRTLPILASINEEGIRIAISKLFSKVCECVIISNENAEQSNKKISSNESIAHLFSTAFDLIYAQWLQSKSPNKFHIINALIMIGSLLPESNIRNNMENIINVFINNFKKDNLEDMAILAKSFRIFFEALVPKYKERIEVNVSPILVSTFPVLTSVNISPNVKDFDVHYMNVKSELLKIYYILFKNYIDKMFTFILSRFEVNSLIERLTNIYLIKTMLLRSEPLNNSYRDMLLSAISKATHESDYEFKYSLCELIHVLFEKDLLTQEGSIKLLSYLVKESGYTEEEITNKDTNSNYIFNTNLKAIRDKAETVLMEIVNKVQNSDRYLWPYILDYLVDYKYSGSSLIVCRIIQSIKTIFDNNKKSLLIDFQESNLPSPSQILIKFFIILASPHKRTGLSINALLSLKICFPLLFREVTNSNLNTSDLEQYVLRRSRYFDENFYLEQLQVIWERALVEIKLGEHLSSLSENINEFIIKHKEDENTVGFLLRLQGLLLSKMNKREVIKNSLDNVFHICHPEYKNDQINGNLDPSVPSKYIRNGVSEAFGLSAKSHLDLVIDKVNAIFKADIQFKKPTGFSALFGKTSAPDLSQQIITTLIFALGSIAKYADAGLIATRINSNFLSHIDNYFKDDKNIIKPLKYACLVSLGNIFKTLFKLSSIYLDKGEVFTLQNRDSYLESMIKIVKNEKTISESKISALNNIAYLTNLDPPVSLEQCKTFINLAFSVFENFNEKNDLHIKSLEATNNILESILVHDVHFSVSNEKVTVTENPTFVYEFMLDYEKDILSSWDFFSLILEKFTDKFIRSQGQLKDIITERIEIFINSKKSVKFKKEEFINWITCFNCLLILYYDDSLKDNQGIYICLTRLLTSIDVYELQYNNDKSKTIDELVKILITKLDKTDFLSFFKHSFYLLNNKLLSVNKYSSMLVEKLLLERSQDFIIKPSERESLTLTEKEISEIFEKLVRVLENISKEDESILSERFKNVIKIAEEFSKINLQILLDTCLNEKYGLPLPVCLTSILKRVCKEKSLVSKIFAKMSDILNNGDPGYENRPNYSVCAATIVMGTILETKDPTVIPLIKKFFPQLLSTILLRVGSSHSINYTVDAYKKSEDPRNQTVWCLQQLMRYAEEEELLTCLEGGSLQNKLLSSTEYDEGIYELMLIFCKVLDHNKQSLMYDFLQGFIDRQWNGQRVVVVSCYAQFVNFASIIHCKDPEINIIEWRNKLILELTKTITDSDELARKQSIRGLSNLCKVFLDCTVYIDQYIKLTESIEDDEEITDEFREQVKKKLKKEMLEASYGTSIINLLIEKLSDNQECVVLESLNSLKQMMEFLTVKAIIPVITNLLIKLRPCFDNANHNVRSLGFNLFNRIIGLVHVNKNENKFEQGGYLESQNLDKDEIKIGELIKDQIHVHLVSLLLHSNDENSGVKNNCLKTLNKGLNILFNSEILSKSYDELKEKYSDDGNKIYDEYILIIGKMLSDKFPQRIPHHIINSINHSLSAQDIIRANSAYLIGVLYFNLSKSKSEYLKTISLENVFANYCKLLKDFSSKVKIKTIKALSFFKNMQTSVTQFNY